ncbi:GNAT family N-acetyltransferase [Legionella sp. km772]|uniref:GNAT family N-acetyltransferase n=1 Tax=Legionella sp. km772 TaxID=2498111 RepID=UPI000F8E7905|nr:GNAT family N-acetyltransferase [Legionella sp. km772]RUR10167.1 GNAT family N-acetyltransferase [Legionella sp. km772]
MIQNTNQISASQLIDLKQLTELCKKKDGSIPNLYTHILTQPRAFPASLLFYEDKQLLAFLSVYFFYDDAVEVSLLVHPAHRKQGIAKQLLQTIFPLIQFQNYFKLIFSTPSGMNNKLLLNAGYTYCHSEYYMERCELTPVLEYKHNLTFRLATVDDIPVLCTLDECCFPEKHGDLLDRFNHLLDSREYKIVLAYQDHLLIGKAHLRWEEKGATLSDIAVYPQYQGKGYGTTLIAHCINHALEEGKPLLNLDVETHNKRALNLYTRLGFAVQNACDFWSIDIEQLKQVIGS